MGHLGSGQGRCFGGVGANHAAPAVLPYPRAPRQRLQHWPEASRPDPRPSPCSAAAGRPRPHSTASGTATRPALTTPLLRQFAAMVWPEQRGPARQPEAMAGHVAVDNSSQSTSHHHPSQPLNSCHPKCSDRIGSFALDLSDDARGRETAFPNRCNARPESLRPLSGAPRTPLGEIAGPPWRYNFHGHLVAGCRLSQPRQRVLLVGSETHFSDKNPLAPSLCAGSAPSHEAKQDIIE